MNIIGISGSLRADSYNTLLLKAAAVHLPAGVTFELLSADLPLYSEELDGEQPPAAVAAAKRAVAAADAVLIATPEYNHSFSGVIKNAVDWISRPAFASPLKDKKIGLLSASMSPVGGVRAQAQLRPVLASALSEVYPGLEFSLGSAQNAFDANGQLLDEAAQRRLKRFVEGFLGWAG